jgi:hypothetical protein
MPWDPQLSKAKTVHLSVPGARALFSTAWNDWGENGWLRMGIGFKEQELR